MIKDAIIALKALKKNEIGEVEIRHNSEIKFQICNAEDLKYRGLYYRNGIVIGLTFEQKTTKGKEYFQNFIKCKYYNDFDKANSENENIYYVNLKKHFDTAAITHYVASLFRVIYMLDHTDEIECGMRVFERHKLEKEFAYNTKTKIGLFEKLKNLFLF